MTLPVSSIYLSLIPCSPATLASWLGLSLTRYPTAAGHLVLLILLPEHISPRYLQSSVPHLLGSVGKDSVCNAGVPSLIRKIPLEEEMVTHSSILAWEIPRAEELSVLGIRKGGIELQEQTQLREWTTRTNSLQLCPTLCDPMDRNSSGFSVHGIVREEYWSGLPCPHLGDLPHPEIELSLLFLLGGQTDSLPLTPPRKPTFLSSWLKHPLLNEPSLITLFKLNAHSSIFSLFSSSFSNTLLPTWHSKSYLCKFFLGLSSFNRP